MASDTPSQVGPYDILGVIGKGGMGVVYKGFQHSLSRLVAIKVLPPEFQSDPERVERFHREAQAIAILSHPNIVQIIDKGSEGKTLYFVMEFVDGVSLDTLLRERRLTLVESLHVAKEIAKGLAGAHASGIIHRDLKPRNVLVSRDLSMVKLVDFGISRVEVLSQAAGPLTSAHTSLGTLYYYSPEQARDPSKVDQRSDIYSLGVICYEMLTGQVPVGQFQLPSEVNPELSSQVDALLLKCLATDRAKRYAGAKDFLADVDKLGEGGRNRLARRAEDGFEDHVAHRSPRDVAARAKRADCRRRGCRGTCRRLPRMVVSWEPCPAAAGSLCGARTSRDSRGIAAGPRDGHLNRRSRPNRHRRDRRFVNTD